VVLDWKDQDIAVEGDGTLHVTHEDDDVASVFIGVSLEQEVVSGGNSQPTGHRTRKHPAPITWRNIPPRSMAKSVLASCIMLQKP